MKNMQPTLIRNLFFLISIFMLGFLAILLTNYFFVNFKHHLDLKTVYLENKIKLGEYIIEDLLKIRSNYYELALSNNKENRLLIKKEIIKESEKIERILKVLRDGGVLEREVKLNIAGHFKYIKIVKLNKSSDISIETITILPKLKQLLRKIKNLMLMLNSKQEYINEYKLNELNQLNKKIRKFYKSSPAFFTRILENSRRLLYESEIELKKIKEEIKEKKRHSGHIKNIIIGLTTLLVLFFGWITAKDIGKNNIKLKALNNSLGLKIEETKKQELFIRSVLNSQSSIILVNNGKELIDANSTLLYFFDQYKDYVEFKQNHNCICDFFVIPDDVDIISEYIMPKDYNGKNWVDYILDTPSIPHKVAMRKRGRLHHFYIWATHKKITQDEIVVIITLNDITYDISRQKRLRTLNEHLKNSFSDIENLLNNSNQGFLSFSQDLIIKKQYSKICLKFFGDNISDKDISKLLYPNRFKKRDFFQHTIKSLDLKDKSFKNSTILSLLQKEFIFNKRVVEVEYKVLDGKNFMMILTDITEKRILEKKVNREGKILKMVLSVIKNRDEFLELLENYNIFIENLFTKVKLDWTILENCNNLFMEIHTFKGLFLQKELIYTSHFLHNFETELSSLMETIGISNRDLLNFLKKNCFYEALNKDLNIIEEMTDEDFFKGGRELKIRQEDIDNIEQKIIFLNLEQDKKKEILNDLKHLKNQPFYMLMDSYPKFIEQMSQRLNKSIHPLKLKIDKNITLDYNIKPFIQSLVHIFRNAIDHGIEPLEERLFKNKDELGTITCDIFVKNSKLKIIISDDGRGINIEKIKQKAKKLNIKTKRLDKVELINLIFHPKFSTKNKISEISGRGVGLSAVKKELQNINGEVSIDTIIGKGTTFNFSLPK